MKSDSINIALNATFKQPFYKAVINAVNGIVAFLQTERNGKIQFTVASLTIVFGFLFKISTLEWVDILICITTVFSLEMINSALETICDLVTTEYHPSIKRIKDVAAGAVLIAACASVITGAVIFLPKILMYL